MEIRKLPLHAFIVYLHEKRKRKYLRDDTDKKHRRSTIAVAKRTPAQHNAVVCVRYPNADLHNIDVLSTSESLVN